MPQPFPHGPLCSQESLTSSLHYLRITPGYILLVHSSLRSQGWLSGGAEIVVRALVAALNPGGTLVVPTYTSENSDPKDWEAPPVPKEWWGTIRESMPGFYSPIMPSREMGAIPEMVQTWPDAMRGAHPRRRSVQWSITRGAS